MKIVVCLIWMLGSAFAWRTAHPLALQTSNQFVSKTASVLVECENHEEIFEFEQFVSDGSTILDLCMNRFCNINAEMRWTLEACEDLSDSVFDNWMGSRYFPSLHINLTHTEHAADFLVSRGTVLGILAEKFNYNRYLEIGTARNEIFSFAQQAFEVAVGVDPSSGGTHRMTSDVFFEEQNNQVFDLIFVDGLHEANQVYRDVVNAVNVLAPGGTVVMHDCNPHGILRSRASWPQAADAVYWNGNTWKAIVALRLLRNDLDIAVVDADHGIGVLRVRPNTSPYPVEWVDILRPLMDVGNAVDEFALAAEVIATLTDDYLRLYRTALLRLMSVDQMLEWIDDNNNYVQAATT